MGADFGIPPDATAVMWRYLVRVLPDRTDREGRRVEYVHRQYLPDGWSPKQGIAVVVSDDASQYRGIDHDRSLVRVSVHAPTLDMARKWGRSINTFLLSPMGGLGLGIDRRRSTGVPVAPDSLAGGFVATASYSCGMSKLFNFS